MKKAYFLTGLLLLSIFSSRLFSQTVIFSSGFETGDPAFTYATDGGSGTCSNVTAAPRTGTNNGRLIGASSDGSIITPLLNFTAGKYYLFEVYSAATKCAQSLDIRKSVTATNTAMKAAAGADIVLNGTNNVNLTSYIYFSAVFKPSANESKYVGFQMINGGCGGPGTSTQDIDDIVITEMDYPPCNYYCTTGNTSAITSYVSNVGFNNINRGSAWDGYICTGNSTPVQRTLSYNLDITTYNATTSVKYVAAWIDWNIDGDYADGGEQVLAPTAITTGSPPQTLVTTQSVAVPAGATLGTSKMRVTMVIGTSAQTVPCNTVQLSDYEDYDIDIQLEPVPMAYVSSAVTQTNTASVNAGSFDNEVIGVQIVTSGELTPLNVTSFTFNTTATTGTTNPANDITTAKLWSTGTNTTFGTTTQIGSQASPNGSFTIATAYTLEKGTNYFWLTYDVPSTAPGGDYIDAKCTSLNVGGARTPSPSDPAGSRLIIGAWPMTYVSSAVVQNDATVAKGDVNQYILRIEIVTDGAASPMSATSFSFNTTGTTAPLADIQNAKLFFSGLSSTFSTSTQVGSTVAAPNGAFNITPSVAEGTLQFGTNYFWLTYDIKSGAGCNPNQADGQCTSITIGGSPRVPSPTAPAGARVINCGTPYFSQCSCPVNTLTNWNSLRGGGGSAPADFGAGNAFYVQSGHTMSTSANITIANFYVEGGGKVVAGNLITMTNFGIYSNGIFEQTANAASTTYITNFFIYNGGQWTHNNTGYLPGTNRYFSPLSIQYFPKWGAQTWPSGTAWGILILDFTTNTSYWEMQNTLQTVQTDIEFRSNGNKQAVIGSGNTINIGRDLKFTGNFYMAGSNGANSVLTWNVGRDFIMSAGTFRDVHSKEVIGFNSNGGTRSVLNVGRNVTITGGSFNYTIQTTTVSTINLGDAGGTGGSVSGTWTQTGGTVTLTNTNILNLPAGKTITMAGNNLGDVASGRTFIINSGATLNCSNYPVTGAGNFTLASGGTIGIGSADGITSAGATGNVQVTGTRSYNSGASYRYYEAQNPQTSGNFTTTPTANTVAGLIMDKTNATDVVTLTNTTNVTGALTLTNGILTTSTTSGAAPYVRVNNGGTVSPAGGSLNSYVDGYMQKQGFTNGARFDFPLGDGGWWRKIGANIQTTSGTDVFEAIYIKSAYTDIITYDAGITDVSQYEHWFLTRINGAPNAAVTLFWGDAPSEGINDCSTAPPTGDLIVVRYDGAKWVNQNTSGGSISGACAASNDAGLVTSDNYVTAFSPFTFGSKSLAVNPLPVILLSFDAVYNGTYVDLTWVTASEINNDYFTVERSSSPSLSGEGWGEVVKVDGAGNSNEEIPYYAVDRNPYSGVSYYRLKQTDFDGRYTYSDIVAVNIARTYDFSIQPNPAKNTLNVSISCACESDVNIEFTNIIGKTIKRVKYSVKQGSNTLLVDIRSLLQGLYFIKVSAGEDVYMEKFVKE